MLRIKDTIPKGFLLFECIIGLSILAILWTIYAQLATSVWHLYTDTSSQFSSLNHMCTIIDNNALSSLPKSFSLADESVMPIRQEGKELSLPAAHWLIFSENKAKDRHKTMLTLRDIS